MSGSEATNCSDGQPMLNLETLFLHFFATNMFGDVLFIKTPSIQAPVRTKMTKDSTRTPTKSTNISKVTLLV